jgi:hypothetical protein
VRTIPKRKPNAASEIPVRPLDVVIQRGTNHYWINRSSDPALLMSVLLDAVFDVQGFRCVGG